LTCNTCYIGKNYKGSIGTTSAMVDFDVNYIHFNSAYAGCHVNLNDSILTVAEVWISDTSRTVGSWRLTGKYNATLKRTRHNISLLTATTSRVDAHSSRASFTCSDDVTTVRISGAFATLEDGAGTLTITNRGSAEVSRVDYDDTNIIIASNASVRCLAEELGTITMYSGISRFMGNEGAPIVVARLEVYTSAVADTRTGAATFTLSSGALLYGGRILFDGSMDTAIA